jgi:hypothetical protein
VSLLNPIINEQYLEDGIILLTFQDNHKEYRQGTILHNPSGPAMIFPNGDQVWYLHGQHHRLDGPAIERSFMKCWKIFGKLHRVNLPAVIADDYQAYYQNDQLHNIHGPAQIYTNGDLYFYQFGKLHNLHGPAIIRQSQSSWCINGEYIPVSSQEEFNRYLNLKSFW